MGTKEGEDGADGNENVEPGEALEDLELQIDMQDDLELDELNQRIKSEHDRQLAEELARQEADQAKMLEDAIAQDLSEENALQLMSELEQDNLEFEKALAKEQELQHNKMKDRFM